MKIYIAPVKMGSEGATALARSIGALKTKALKRFKRGTTLVNWGRTDLTPRGFPQKVLNHAAFVKRAVNKITCFQTLKQANVPHVPFTTSRQEAALWLSEGAVIYERHIINGSQGRGIIVTKAGDTLNIAPLYTKGILKAHEYRVHVFKGMVIDVTKKRKRNAAEHSDYIKNLANGWVFCRDNITIPDEVKTIGVSAIRALGLDFGAVDVLYRERENKAWVLEVNTAPGLQGTTLERYKQAFNILKYVR